jgi:hypothetical protein
VGGAMNGIAQGVMGLELAKLGLEMNQQSYKAKNPNFDVRKAESDKIKDRYNDRIPVICERAETSKLPDIDKTKYLVRELMRDSRNSSVKNPKHVLVPSSSSSYTFEHLDKAY